MLIKMGEMSKIRCIEMWRGYIFSVGNFLVIEIIYCSFNLQKIHLESFFWGHSKKEFKRFLARLPKRYRAIVEEQSIPSNFFTNLLPIWDINFELLDKDNDNSIDPKELVMF